MAFYWKDLSISKKLYFVVGTMALLILIELLSLRFAMSYLSAVRAFVGGEGLWSKAQKNSVYQLQRYALTKNARDFRAFEEALTVPEGDLVARLELEKPEPDMARIRKGFIQGKIHPDDINSMVSLIRNFQWVSYITLAMKEWSEGDRLLGELKLKAYEYRDLVQESSNPEKINAVLDQINDLNTQLTLVEKRFSDVLGQGSRWLENLVFMILFALVLTVECVGLTITIFTTRKLSRGLADLNHATERIGQGDFGLKLPVDSKDELGTLGASVNEMSRLLERSYAELRESHRLLEEKVKERTKILTEVAAENEQLYLEAQSALNMREEFLSIASHELRTPITSLILQLQLLERSTARENMNQDRFRQQLKSAMSTGKRLSLLQDTLMDFTEIRLGKFEVKKENFDIAALAAEIATQLAEEARIKETEIHIHAPVPVPGMFDPTRSAQVITNLLTNAIKYGEGHPVCLEVRADDKYAYVSVKDQGPGIAPDQHDKILERYERANTNNSIAGLGLGLYISKKIMDSHQGKLTIESVPGKGAVFTAVFPLS